MVRFLPLSFACLIFTSMSACAQINNRAAVRQFQAMYSGLNVAYMNHDARAAARYYAEDYAGGTYGNLFDKKRTLDAVKHGSRMLNTTTRTVLSVIVNGQKATATVDLVTKGAGLDRAGKRHVFLIDARCLDTWIHNAPGWQMRHSKVIRYSATKDGKPMYENTENGRRTMG